MMNEFLLRMCQVQLKFLNLDLCSEPLQKATAKLQNFIRQHCDHLNNPIPATVTPSELSQILSNSSLSISQLTNAQAPYPQVCLHGRQRVEVAVKFLGLNAWWTVKLFCIPEGSDPFRLLRKVIEHAFHETPATDGEVFLKVREYEDHGRHDLAEDWRCRLSKSKHAGLRAIELRYDLLTKLCQLRVFTGLWDGLELGNIQKHVALHATDPGYGLDINTKIICQPQAVTS